MDEALYQLGFMHAKTYAIPVLPEYSDYMDGWNDFIKAGGNRPYFCKNVGGRFLAAMEAKRNGEKYEYHKGVIYTVLPFQPLPLMA